MQGSLLLRFQNQELAVERRPTFEAERKLQSEIEKSRQSKLYIPISGFTVRKTFSVRILNNPGVTDPKKPFRGLKELNKRNPDMQTIQNVYMDRVHLLRLFGRMI